LSVVMCSAYCIFTIACKDADGWGGRGAVSQPLPCTTVYVWLL